MKLKWLTTPTFWGSVLILAGILFLLQNLGILPAGNMLIAAGAGLVGIMFVGLFLGDRNQWWAIIPAIALIALASLMLMDIFFPGAAASWGGSFFLGVIGFSFLAVYITHREHWWALIPGGVMTTLAVVAGLGSNVQDDAITGGVFFLGLGLTFLLVAILPNPAGKMTWAYIPAAVLVIMGMSMIAFTANLIPYLVAIIFIVIGALLLIRAVRN